MKLLTYLLLYFNILYIQRCFQMQCFRQKPIQPTVLVNSKINYLTINTNNIKYTHSRIG